MESAKPHFFSGLSGKTVLATLLVLGYFVFNNGIPFILNWDLFGHHAYLPLIFNKGTLVTHDLSYFETIQQQYHNSPTLYQFVLLENGNFMIKYTSGWALLMLPFYCIAEVWASLGNYPKDGFSFPYQAMTAIGAFCYFAWSVFILRKLLLKFFSDRLAALLIVLVIFGTNVFFMEYASLGISHSLEFFLISLMLLLTVQFHENITLGKGIQLGLVIGLIALVRPPDVITALIPLGWNARQYGGFFKKIAYFFKTYRKIVLCAVVAVLIAFSPQIIYWKISAGKFFMNSYANNPGEGFDWFTPYLLQVLFSFKKGWLLYTPLMIFAISGFFSWRKKQPQQGNIALISFLVFLYVISCWTCWWYAESYSQRALVDIYPLLAVAFGFFFLGIREMKFRFVFYVLTGIFFVFNLFQTFQATRGILHLSRVTQEYYFSTFGQVSAPSAEQLALLSIDRVAEEEKGFDPAGYRKCYSKTFDFGHFRLTKDTIYTSTIDILPADVTQKEYFWLVCTWKYNGSPKQLEGKIFNSCGMYKGKPYSWKGSSVADSTFQIDTLRKEVTFTYLSPHFRTKKDPVRLSVWNQFGEDIEIEGVKVEGYVED